MENVFKETLYREETVEDFKKILDYKRKKIWVLRECKWKMLERVVFWKSRAYLGCDEKQKYEDGDRVYRDFLNVLAKEEAELLSFTHMYEALRCDIYGYPRYMYEDISRTNYPHFWEPE